MAWIGQLDDVLHYLTVVGADRSEDGFVISGEPVISGLDPQEVVVPDGTVYFVDSQPKNLAAGLASTSRGVGGLKVYDNPPKSRHRAAFGSYMKSAEQHLRLAKYYYEVGDKARAWDLIRHADCDIRQAYTEASYGKRDDADLGRMTSRLERIYPEVTAVMVALREQNPAAHGPKGPEGPRKRRAA